VGLPARKSAGEREEENNLLSLAAHPYLYFDSEEGDNIEQANITVA
jgi:hypothetical protein